MAPAPALTADRRNGRPRHSGVPIPMTLAFTPILAAVERGGKGGTKGDFGLAETDVTADQPVHGPPAAQVGHGVVDGLGLVFGLGIGKAGREFFIVSLLDGDTDAGFQLPGRGDTDQLIGHVADALLQPRLAGLPGSAAEPVEYLLPKGKHVSVQEGDFVERGDPRFYKLLAEAENDLGETTNSHFSLSEYYRSLGELRLALQQLRLAQKTDDITNYQRLRIDARMDEINKEIAQLEQGTLERERQRKERRR